MITDDHYYTSLMTALVTLSLVHRERASSRGYPSYERIALGDLMEDLMDSNLKLRPFTLGAVMSVNMRPFVWSFVTYWERNIRS